MLNEFHWSNFSNTNSNESIQHWAHDSVFVSMFIIGSLFTFVGTVSLILLLTLSNHIGTPVSNLISKIILLCINSIESSHIIWPGIQHWYQICFHISRFMFAWKTFWSNYYNLTSDGWSNFIAAIHSIGHCLFDTALEFMSPSLYIQVYLAWNWFYWGINYNPLLPLFSE